MISFLPRLMLATLCTVMLVAVVLPPSTSARYLPTRSNNDRLDKLRELLKELLENEIEKEEYQPDAPPRWHADRKLFYKREISNRNGQN